MKRFAIALWLIAAPVQAGPLDAVDTHAYAIVDQQVGDVLREFAGAIGRAVDLSEGIEGRVTNFRGSYTARGFLDAVTSRFGLVWYDDGAVIHVSKADTMKSIVIDFDRVPPTDLSNALHDLGVADSRFAIRRTAAGIGVVTGPARYVDMVENTFLMLAARRAEGPPDRPVREAHDMIIVRGEAVSVWSGMVDQDEMAASAGDADPEVIDDTAPPGS